ncbi:MAG: LTA synthase family protein [Fibrobacteraceae bacterium]|nr:LTA synthase family protein [Fibrobacteraceae bacterium]
MNLLNLPHLMKKKNAKILTAIAAVASITVFICYYQQDRGTMPTLLALLMALCIFLLLHFIGKKNRDFRPRCTYCVGTFLFILLTCFAGVSLRYDIATFPISNIDEVIQTLEMPLDGFSNIFIKDWLSIALPLSIVIALTCFYPLRKAMYHKKATAIILPITLTAILIYPVILVLNRVHVNGLIRYANYFLGLDDVQEINSDLFLKKHFANLQHQNATIDSLPYNLVYIIMESAENDFLPYMEPLKELYSSEYSVGFGGGFSCTGASNTIQSSIAKTTGVPLLVLNQKTMGIVQRSSENFFANVPSMYNVLSDAGYRNVFVQGSNSDFAKTRLFFLTHGIHTFYDNLRTSTAQDISQAKEAKVLAEGFVEAQDKNPNDNWHDKKLLQKARKILDTLSQKGPFSLTITTMDTHFPYGFLDPSCEQKPVNKTPEEIMKATLACSAKEVAEFVKWVQSQPYGPNTEIVITGDHTFMGETLVQKINQENRRWIDLFINTKQPLPQQQRNFSSMDIAPTILESMGIHIENSRMGLGVSLYSKQPTLVEQMGLDSMNAVLKNMKMSRDYLELMLQ